MNQKISVVLFCGGRGSASIIREMIRNTFIDLTLLINAYDDGLSTGELRNFIPGMLGPSDFRKNLSYLIHLYSSQQYILTQLLEFRFPKTITEEAINGFRSWSKYGKQSELMLIADFYAIVESMDSSWISRCRHFLNVFFDYEMRQATKINYADCSLGNLIFSGAYLDSNQSFNAAIQKLAQVFGARAQLVNVSGGENRFLVALKEDGEVLEKEGRVVGQQTKVPIYRIYLLKEALNAVQIQALQAMGTRSEKERFLQELDAPVQLSREADEAIRVADIILYGPGTQFSSLIPSYRSTGIQASIQASRAKLKVFIANILCDHDIQGITCKQLIDQVLFYMGDPENQHHFITDVLLTSKIRKNAEVFSRGEGLQSASYLGMQVHDESLEHPVYAGVHNGIRTVKQILDCWKKSVSSFEERELQIYVDLNKRSLALHLLVEEFLEIPWNDKFQKVRLILQSSSEEKKELRNFQIPDYLQIQWVHYSGSFSELIAFDEWIQNTQARYFATITGDGEYRLKDLWFACEFVKNSSFAVVLGSRNQSRRQFLNSLDAAYGESRWLWIMSWLGAFIFSILFALRQGVIFSDPFTGFRLYDREKMHLFISHPRFHHRRRTSVQLVQDLLSVGLEIAEIPVFYKTFIGFTDIKWRIKRGIHNVFRLWF
jgi:2-phospho-L-lactate transferase/gluconeogenesis factor (CofD/UPF0052 family)